MSLDLDADLPVSELAPITLPAVLDGTDLDDLPTAQHKAGLAGLVLQVRRLQASGRLGPSAVIELLTPTTVTLAFTEKSIQTVFDDLYAAALVESPPSKKLRTKRDKSQKPPFRVVQLAKQHPKTGKTKMLDGYVYKILFRGWLFSKITRLRLSAHRTIGE